MGCPYKFIPDLGGSKGLQLNISVHFSSRVIHYFIIKYHNLNHSNISCLITVMILLFELSIVCLLSACSFVYDE
jgi:hypothetical protein